MCVSVYINFYFISFSFIHFIFYGIFYGSCSPIQIKMMMIWNYRNVGMISECHSMSSAIQRRTCHDFILMQVVCINQCTVSDTLILSRIKILEEFEQSFNYSPSTAVFVIRYTINRCHWSLAVSDRLKAKFAIRFTHATSQHVYNSVSLEHGSMTTSKENKKRI